MGPRFALKWGLYLFWPFFKHIIRKLFSPFLFFNFLSIENNILGPLSGLSLKTNKQRTDKLSMGPFSIRH